MCIKTCSDKSTCTNIPTIMAPGMQHPCLFQTYWHLTSCPGAMFQFGYILRISHAQHICSSQDIPRFKCMYRNMKNISIIYFTLRNRQEHMTLHYIRALHHIILYIHTFHYTPLRYNYTALQQSTCQRFTEMHTGQVLAHTLENLENTLPCLHTRVLGSFQVDTLIYVLT